MNIQEAKKEICNTLRAYLAKDEEGYYIYPLVRQRPILLIGPPGIGKTAIMEQAAAECNVGLVSYTITHHTRQSAIGLPEIVKRNYGGKEMMVTDYTMSEIVASVYDCMEKTGKREGILFIDEINCVSETLAPTMLQFLQGKTFGNQKIPQGWIIVAAGNPPEYNKSVREFDIVTLDRIKKINVEANLDVWKEYAYKQGIHPAVISYLELRKQNFYRIETTLDCKAFATARGWEDLSQLIQNYEVLGKTIDRDVIAQYIQHKMIAKDFANQALFIIEDRAHKIAGAISIDEDTEVNALTCWSKQLEPSAELARLVIRETEQNHGLARIMIQNTMEELKKRGVKGVHFLVSKTNERAMRSYQKLNFTKCGESDLYGEDWWCYEKAL